MNKISVKVAIIYIFLGLFNISFFTVVIFENQIDLITENSKYQAKDLASDINNLLINVQTDINQNKMVYNNSKIILSKLTESIDKTVPEYILFSESGEILNKKGDLKFYDDYKSFGIKAFTNKDFLGHPFYTKIDEKKMEILFFMPLNLDLIDNSILFFKYKISDIGKRLEHLYRLIFIIVILLIIFHVIFALIINKIIITPIKLLHKKSVALGKGDLTARVKTKGRDEISGLSHAFNNMASSIQSKIMLLQANEKQFFEELQVAGEVQSTIFPKVKDTDRFELALFHKPFEIVSGDYYDYALLDDNKTCFLIADVCGHGVPAALITMLIKEIFQTSLEYSSDPKKLFEIMNDRIYDLINEYSAFFTAFYLLIDEKNNVNYVSGGHTPALLYRYKTNEIVELNTEGFVLGMMRDMVDVYNFKTEKLESNDMIILYTDGVTEARNSKNNIYTLDMLKDVVLKNRSIHPNDVLENIMKDFSLFMEDKPLQDDATIFIIGVK